MAIYTDKLRGLKVSKDPQISNYQLLIFTLTKIYPNPDFRQ